MRSHAVATAWRAGGPARRQDPGTRPSRGAMSEPSLQWLSIRPHSAVDAKATLLPVHSTPHRNVLSPPRRRAATMRRIFYGLINLAKALTAGTYARRRICSMLTNGKQKLTISQSLPHNITGHNLCGPHVCFLPAIESDHADCECMFCGPRCRLHLPPASASAESSSFHGAQQHVAWYEHVRCAQAHHFAEPALPRNVQAFAGDCETGLLAEAPDRVSQRNRIVRRRSGQLREEHS